MWFPMPGMIVEVEKIGRAKIVKLIGNKALISVDALNGRQIEWEIDKMCPVNEIKQLPNATKLRERENNNILHRNRNNDILKIRTIESLRFGLVPEHHIEELTLVFDELKAWANETFRRCLSGNPCGFEISGPYGTGKSHTLSLIRYLARKQGFLTARVEVDGRNVSLSNSASLLNSLWSTLADNGLDAENPLVDLYIRAINRGNIPTKIITPGFDRIRNNLITIYTLMRTGNIDKYAQNVESVISCSDQITATQAVKKICSQHNINRSQIMLKAMVSKAIKQRGLDLVESIAGHAALARLAGFKGLIVTIDAFEVEYTDKKNITRVEDILYSINQYLNGKTIYYGAPLGIYIATVDQAGHKGDPLIHNYIATDSKNRYRLKIWNRDQRIRLAERIHKMYCEVYKLNSSFDKNLATAVEGLLARKIESNDSGLIRAFIKWYVGFLDIKYGPPRGKTV